MDKYTIAPPAGSSNNSVGAEDRPWHEGYFDSVKLNGGDVGEYLAESTGCGIVSGCTPSIAGLTVTVASGIVHLANGTRKEIASTNITLDSADPTNPRIDLVYINSTGAVAKITGTAAASPSVPSVPANGISVCNVAIAAGATIGESTDKRKIAWQADSKVYYYFPKYAGVLNTGNRGDCEIIRTRNKVMMIDSHNGSDVQSNYIINYLLEKGITKVDYFLLTHYHGDHYGGIAKFINQNKVDFSNTKWLLPVGVPIQSEGNQAAKVQGWLTGRDVTIVDSDRTLYLEDDVRVELFNASAESRAYYANYNNTSAPYNLYSINALIYHGNTVAYFTGDSWGEGFEYLLNHYSLPNVDLYKVNHHGEVLGTNTESIKSITYAYVRRLSPKNSVYNSDFVNISPTDSGLIFYAQNYGNVYSQIEDVEFVSDKSSLNKVPSSNDYIVKTDKHEVINVFIDSNYDYSQGKPDGSPSKPFHTADEALMFIGDKTSTIYLHFASGNQYLHLDGNTKTVFVSAESDTIFLQLYLENCKVVRFLSDITAKCYIQIDYVTRVTFNNLTNLLENGAEDTLEATFSTLLVFGTYTFDGNNTYQGNIIGVYFCPYVYIRFIRLSNLVSHAIYIGQANVFFCQHMYVTNSTKAVFKNDNGISIILVTCYHFTNVARLTEGTKEGLICFSTHDGASIGNKYGETSKRPKAEYLLAGSTYYDTTLKKMLVSDGSAWVDTTTGNTLA